MLVVRCETNGVSVETGVGILQWDARRGGQITGLVIKDDLFSHPLLTDGALPGLCFVVNGKPVKLSDYTASLEVVSETPERVVIRGFASITEDSLQIEMIYEVFREGVVFCEMGIDTPGGKKFDLTDASFNISLDTNHAKNLRWGHFLRDAWTKRDATGIHALTKTNLFLPRDITADERQLFPFVSLDIGWEATRYCSNHIEFIMEDWTVYDEGDVANTRTQVAMNDDQWQLKWSFYDGPPAHIDGPWRYRNKWGFAMARARTRSGDGVDPTVRNNVLGCRLAHCMYPYARQGDRWPWAVMPIKQISVQPPQLFKGNPEISRADEAADLGTNVMIIHQFWMANGGSNNEPVADYRPFDPKWLQAFVARCHEREMRVLLYNRGTEQYQMYYSFFEDHMRKDFDGLYSDWATPFAMGYIKGSSWHVSMYNYFMFSRELRRRVGETGALIGHSGVPTSMAVSTFDALLGGEISIRHDELLTDPENSVYYSFLDASGSHLISGNLPDREAFSGRRALAVCSALGMTGHPFMEPDGPFAKPVAYIKPLWDAMNSLPGDVVRLHNPAYAPTRAVSRGTEALFPSLWQSDAGKALLLVTNLGDTPASGDIEINLSELDVPKTANLKPLNIEGVASCSADGNAVRIQDLEPLWFCAALVE